jgi:hypothetical protein
MSENKSLRDRFINLPMPNNLDIDKESAKQTNVYNGNTFEYSGDRSDEKDGYELVDLTVDVQLLDGTIVPPQDAIITAIDPGSVNCSICTYDIQNERVISIDKVSFRESGHIPDPGYASILGTLSLYLEENKDRLFRKNKGIPFIHVFMEDQYEGAHSRYNENQQREVQAIQYAIQFCLGPGTCLAVSASAIKSHFGEYFPAVERPKRKLTFEEEKKLRRQQYYQDKKNAIKYGKQFLPDSMNDEIERIKQDDPYDALFIAKYAAEKYFKRVDRTTGKEIFPNGINKRKKGKNPDRIMRKRTKRIAEEEVAEGEKDSEKKEESQEIPSIIDKKKRSLKMTRKKKSDESNKETDNGETKKIPKKRRKVDQV